MFNSTERNTNMNLCKHYSENAILNRHTSMNSNLTFITVLNNATKDFQGSREPFHMQALQYLKLFTMFRNHLSESDF